MPKLKSLPEQLEALRLADGRCIYRLASDAGLSRQTTANLLQGGSGAKTLASLEALGEALGVALTWTPLPFRAPPPLRNKKIKWIHTHRNLITYHDKD